VIASSQTTKRQQNNWGTYTGDAHHLQTRQTRECKHRRSEHLKTLDPDCEYVYFSKHTLGLVLANNTILQRRTLLQQENSIRITTLSLVVASAATAVVLGPATIEGLTSSDSDDLAVSLGRRWCGEATSVAIAGKYSGQKQHCDADDLTQRQHFGGDGTGQGSRRSINCVCSESSLNL
jgi:hypothetical protein